MLTPVPKSSRAERKRLRRWRQLITVDTNRREAKEWFLRHRDDQRIVHVVLHANQAVFRSDRPYDGLTAIAWFTACGIALGLGKPRFVTVSKTPTCLACAKWRPR